jgi:hypothetical protein
LRTKDPTLYKRLPDRPIVVSKDPPKGVFPFRRLRQNEGKPVEPVSKVDAKGVFHFREGITGGVGREVAGTGRKFCSLKRFEGS